MDNLDFKGFVEGLWMDDRKAKVGLSKIESPKPPPQLDEPKPAKKLLQNRKPRNYFGKVCEKVVMGRCPIPSEFGSF